MKSYPMFLFHCIIFILLNEPFRNAKGLQLMSDRNRTQVQLGSGFFAKNSMGRKGSIIKLGSSENKIYNTSSRYIRTTSTEPPIITELPMEGTTGRPPTITTSTMLKAFFPDVYQRPTTTMTAFSHRLHEKLHLGLVVPHTSFGKREYTKAYKSALDELKRSNKVKFSFFKSHEIAVHMAMNSLTPSPTGEWINLFIFLILYTYNIHLVVLHNNFKNHIWISLVGWG